jgi:hypothetical protein
MKQEVDCVYDIKELERESSLKCSISKEEKSKSKITDEEIKNNSCEKEFIKMEEFFIDKCKSAIRIICPYSTCKESLLINKYEKINKCNVCQKLFSIYHCPNWECSKIIVTSSFYEGYLVNCKYCNCEFSVISCSKCLRKLVYWSNLLKENQENKENPRILKQDIKSPQESINNFSKSSNFTPNKYYNSDYVELIRYVEGQIIECPYEDCHNKFSQVVCYFCFNSNKFEGEKITSGEKITCLNQS